MYAVIDEEVGVERIVVRQGRVVVAAEAPYVDTAILNLFVDHIFELPDS